MEPTETKSRRWFWYTLYGIFLGVGLLYYMFPSDAVKEYLEATGQRAGPNFLVSVGEVRPSLSFGLKLVDAALSHKARPRTALFLADSLLIKPVLWSFFRAKSAYRFAAHAYDGEVRGSFQFENIRPRGPFITSVELKGVHIDTHASLSTLLGRSVKGTIDGNITYSGQQNLLITGTGEADLRISDGQVELLQPILTLESIDFDELTVRMALRNQTVELTNVELKGREIQGTLSGTVSLEKDFFKSRLNIKGTLEPFAGLFKGDKGTATKPKLFTQRLKKGRASFIIGGTLAQPRIKFM